MRSSSAILALMACVSSVYAKGVCTHEAKGDTPTAGLLAVYSPRKNTVPAGQPYDITWDTSAGQGVNTVSIVLCKGLSDHCVPFRCVADSIANTGSYSWTPRDDLTPSENNEGYGIKIIDDSTGRFQYSDEFGISNTNKPDASTKKHPNPTNTEHKEENGQKHATEKPSHSHSKNAAATTTHYYHHHPPSPTATISETHKPHYHNEKAEKTAKPTTHLHLPSVINPSHGIYNSANATSTGRHHNNSHHHGPKTKTVKGSGAQYSNLQIISLSQSSKTAPLPVTSVDVANGGVVTNAASPGTAGPPATTSSTPSVPSGAAIRGKVVGGEVLAGVGAAAVAVLVL